MPGRGRTARSWLTAAIPVDNPDCSCKLTRQRDGQWSGGEGPTTHGNVSFHTRTEEYYREHIELPFLRRHLATPSDATPPPLPKAIVFEVGTNVWKRYETWPPAEAKPKTLHFLPGGKLSFEPEPTVTDHDEWISDPANPVPYTTAIAIGMTREHVSYTPRGASLLKPPLPSALS